MGLRIDYTNEAGLVRHLVLVCETCGVEVNDEQLKAGGGLLEMGWTRRFNNRPEARRNEYFCPKHKGAAL